MTLYSLRNLGDMVLSTLQAGPPETARIEACLARWQVSGQQGNGCRLFRVEWRTHLFTLHRVSETHAPLQAQHSPNSRGQRKENARPNTDTYSLHLVASHCPVDLSVAHRALAFDSIHGPVSRDRIASQPLLSDVDRGKDEDELGENSVLPQIPIYCAT